MFARPFLQSLKDDFIVERGKEIGLVFMFFSQLKNRVYFPSKIKANSLVNVLNFS